MRNALEFDFATEILDVLGAALADTHAGDDGLFEFLALGRNRRANNQWNEKQGKETNLAKHGASPLIVGRAERTPRIAEVHAGKSNG